MRTKTKLTVLPGDGIGPEVITQAMRVLRTVADLCGYELEVRECPVGGVAIKQSQSPFHHGCLPGERCRAAGRRGWARI